MGYRKEIMRTFNRGTCIAALVTETADICQLLSNGNVLMIDRVDLEAVRRGEKFSMHAIIQNIETGAISSNKYYKLGEEVDDDLWIENDFKRSYETEFDYS
jgi:hypothetical protein